MRMSRRATQTSHLNPLPSTGGGTGPSVTHFYDNFRSNLEGVVLSVTTMGRKMAQFKISDKVGEIRAKDKGVRCSKVVPKTPLYFIVGLGLPLNINGLPKSKYSVVDSADDFVSILRS